MRKIAFLFITVLVLVSCKKNDAGTNGNQPLSAQNIANVPYGADVAQKMDVYLPAGRTDTTKMIVLVHGGAWSTGDKTDFTTYVSTLQQRLPGYAVANINYRLASPGLNVFPTQENDMKAAVNFLIQKSSEYHISQQFVLLGASSGAHMALLQAYKVISPRIAAVVDFFGPVDMVDMFNAAGAGTINQLGIQILMSGTPATNPALYQSSSPINFVTAQSPPTIILHGTADDVVNISESITLKNKLQSFGVINQMVTYTGQGHDVWPDPIMTDAFDKIQAFVRANVH